MNPPTTYATPCVPQLDAPACGDSRAPRRADSLRAQAARARHCAEEYERALSDYTQLMRHRIANPLTAIRGSAQTLRDLPSLDDDTRTRLLEIIVEMAERIEQVSLEPRSVSVEERCLDAVPRVSYRWIPKTA